MAQTNYTPISLYYSTTASAVPTAANLVPGELAINTADGKLYYEDSSGVVQVLATKSTGSIGGSNTQVQFNNSGSLGGSSGLTWDGSFLTTSSIKNSALTSGRVTYAGASGLLSDSANLVFNGTQLGIATNSPIYTLDVNGDVKVTNTLRYYVGATQYGLSFANAGAVGTEAYQGTYIYWGTGSGASATEKMRITNTGLVGIGTSSPSYTLDVLNSASATLTTRIKNSNASGLSGILFDNNSSTAGASVAFNSSTNLFEFWTNSDNGFRWGYAGSSSSFTERMRLDASGNLGLGVTPSAWQTTSGSRAIQFTGSAVYGYRDTNLILTQNAYFDGGFKYYASSIASAYYGIGSGVHAWYTAPSGTAGNAITFTQAMTLDASGNLLVGTTSIDSGFRLNVVGGGIYSLKGSSGTAFQTSNLTSADFSIATTSGGITNIGTTGNVLAFTTGSERMRIDTAGIVTMSAYGAGAATFSASGVISSVSDETWKTKDGVPTNTDAMLQKLEPGYWFYNEEKAPTFGADRQLGFYAQNVHEAIGEEAAPTPEEGKPWGYYDRSVLAITVMSLKNALNTIEELKQRIETLENK